MKLEIDATEVSEDLAKCKPGDKKMIAITVGEKTGETITGEATAVEHVTGDEEYEDEDEEEMKDDDEEGEHGKMGKSKVPKAILLVAGK